MKSHFDLPRTLTANLADSDVEVISWSAQSQELVLEVVKDASPERGLLRFTGVALVKLAPRFTIHGISVESSRTNTVSNETQEFEFNIEDAYGERHCVVAESLTYTVDA
jgi:hypothetical protein